METNKIHFGDCFDILPTLPDKSIDAIITDPPYFQIRGAFDFIWESMEDFLKFVAKAAGEFKRVLKPNGSVIWFGHAKNIAYIQVELDKYFNLLNSCVWQKPDCLAYNNSPDNMRSFLPVTERFLFYEQKSSPESQRTGTQEIYSNPECFVPIKQYMRSERDKLMKEKGIKTISQFNEFINEWTSTSNVVSRHYFADSQYMFPTKEIYTRMQETGFWLREYEELRREYEELRREYEELRRPFNNIHKIEDVIICKTEVIREARNKPIHPTQKPMTLMRKIIETITNKGGIILDPFAGSGTTGDAAIQTGRQFILVEKEKEYYDKIVKRLNYSQAMANSKLF